MLSDAPLYSAHRSMQIHDTELLLSSTVRQMDWSQEDQDVVMDIGCGSGNSCCKIILPSYPRVKKVIAVDVLKNMIVYARQNNAHEKIEYHVADIEDERSMAKWDEQISKVVSIYCFNWLGNQKEAFKNIYRVLKPGGEAALLFVLSTPFWDSYSTHIENPRWSKFLENANLHVPESHYKKHGASYYRSLLEDIGFRVVVCEDEDRTYIYPNDEDCRAASYSRSALSSYIPDELKSEIKEDLFQGFLKHSGRSSDGRPMLYYSTLTLLIQKPNA